MEYRWFRPFVILQRNRIVLSVFFPKLALPQLKVVRMPKRVFALKHSML